MIRAEGLNQWNRVELRIYRFLGIDYFRKAVLMLEKVKYRKNRKFNENYHLSGMNAISLSRYKGFILYNSFLHCVSLLFTFLYLIVSRAFGVNNWIFDIVILLMLILNVLCITLQRNNYLRIAECYNGIGKRYGKRVQLKYDEIINNIKEENFEDLWRDYWFVCRLYDSVYNGHDFVIETQNIVCMERIYNNVKSIVPKNKKALPRNSSEVKVIEVCNTASGPYSILQKRANKLQQRFGIKGIKILDHNVIVTANAECEKAYRALIPVDTTDNICFVSYFLYGIYSNAINKENSCVL